MLITVDKKAANEAEAAAILAESYRIDNPYGIPTLVLRPEEFAQMGSQNEITAYLEPRLKTFFHSSGHFPAEIGEALYQASVSPGQIRRFAWDLIKCAGPSGVFNAKANTYGRRGAAAFAHQSTPSQYPDPYCNIVFSPRADAAGTSFAASQLRADRNSLPELPGLPAQWQFVTLWHEYGHGAGADEAQTEKMAAVMYRKYFTDTKILEASLDVLAAGAVLNAGNILIDQDHDWSMVEALQSALAMDESAIDAMDEAAVKAIRFERFESYKDAVVSLSAKLQSLAPQAFENRDLKVLALEADSALKKDDITAEERRIAIVFIRALTRLTEGTAAYNDGSHDTELQKDARPGQRLRCH